MTDWVAWAEERFREDCAKSLALFRANFEKQGYRSDVAEEMAQKSASNWKFRKDAAEAWAVQMAAVEDGSIQRVGPVLARRHECGHEWEEVPWLEGIVVNAGLALVAGGKPTPVGHRSFRPRDLLVGSSLPVIVGDPPHGTSESVPRPVLDKVRRLEESFCDKYRELLPRILEVGRAKIRELEKSRRKAESPGVKAKREEEARARVRAGFTATLYRSRDVVRESSAEDVMKLFESSGDPKWVALVNELARWRATNPLGSKVVRLEDVEEALQGARVREVLES